MWVVVEVDYSKRLGKSLIMENSKIVDKLYTMYYMRYTFELNPPIDLRDVIYGWVMGKPNHYPYPYPSWVGYLN
jgi:hypothetical protein